MRAVFGSNSQMWSGKLSQEQQDRWSYAGSQVMRHPSLGQKGPPAGQQFCQASNSGLPRGQRGRETGRRSAKTAFSWRERGWVS
jgi:hypothetical protein